MQTDASQIHADAAVRALLAPLDQLPDPLPIPPLPARRGRPALDLALRTPGSKSLTNRALLLAALADGTSSLGRPLLDAEDAERMIEAVARLGASVQKTPSGDLHVTGVGGRWRTPAGGITLELANAGTATRFLAAAAILSPAAVTIDGNKRMRQRPIGELAGALESLGARVEFAGEPGCPPLRVTPPAELPRGMTLEFEGELASSQFISALMLVAAFLPVGLTIKQQGEVTSASYIAMTAGLLDRLGATVRTSDDLRVVRVGPPRGRDRAGGAAPEGGAASGRGAPRALPAFVYDVEPDASGATYFWAAAALFPGASVRIVGLGGDSLQGDAEFPEELARMGAVATKRADEPSIGVRGGTAIEPVLADLSKMPDTAMTLAAVACFAGGRSILRGLRTLRVKETDRIEAIRAELTKVGVEVATNVLGDPDTITINPPPRGLDCSPTAAPVEFETYDDHRMAMSLALVGLRRPNVLVRNPRCVAKTYPTFWRDLARLYD